MKKLSLLISLLLIFCISFVKAGYIDEYPEAYKRAFNNWITTQDTIEKANMYWEITRIELSKMISNYAINVLKKRQDLSKNCDFTDVSNELNLSYDLWVVKACQLWLMWQWIKKFRPYDKVTRAEFGTILSRLLYWNKYDWWTPYYKRHVNQLNIRWIMNNTKNTEKINESRGNVMVMLKRSQNLWNINIPSFEELADVVNDKCPSDFDWSYDVVTKRWYIIPYKNWYIWFDSMGQEWWEVYLTYKDLKNPCYNIYQSDIVLQWRYYEDYRNNVYITVRDGNSKKTEIIKNLNCATRKKQREEERDKLGDERNHYPNINLYIDSKKRLECWEKVEHYVYDLITWEEENEYFTQWMNNFKRDIDNISKH